MNKFLEVKKVLENRQVVQKYLGTPSKITFKGDWYLSPFREEKTASLYVSKKGIHDFGSSKHYDIIDFVSEYYKVKPLQALKILCNDFGIVIKEEHIDKESLKKIKQERAKQKELKEESIKFYNEEVQKLCDEIQINQKLIQIFKKSFKYEALEVLYGQEIFLELKFEEVTNMTTEDKVRWYLCKNKQEDLRRQNK